MILPTLYTFVATTIWMLALAAFLVYAPRVNLIGGQRLAYHLSRAPLLDFLVAGFTWFPWVIGIERIGWWGLLAALAGQAVALAGFVHWHERVVHPQATRGPTISGALNRLVGKWQNHAALYVTLIALPGFWIIRLQQIVCYPFLVWLLGFPRYKHGDWINVSRQKFDGLVGHDLVWCLYCDWMTGVYSLGAEMLRNVESFWCPIRFYDGKKCANCKTDFPDIEQGWVPPTGNMQDVVDTIDQQYGDGRREWFGHPARLTVNGKEPNAEV